MKKNDPLRGFWNAICSGELPGVRAALKAGADPNAPFPVSKSREGGMRPLMLATHCGQVGVCKELLARGADPDAGGNAHTPLLEAAAAGHAELVALFKKHGARGSFFTQVALGETAAATRALKKAPSLAAARDGQGWTPLHYAAGRLNLTMIALLLKHGADADAHTDRDVTPLHVLSNLRGADPEAQRAAIERLVAHGADVNAEDWRGVRPLFMAVRSRSVAACQALLQAGAEVNVADRGRGSTPLHRAVTNTGAGGTKGKTQEALAIAQLLLEYGADPNAKDARGRGPEKSAQGPAMRNLLKRSKKRA